MVVFAVVWALLTAFYLTLAGQASAVEVSAGVLAGLTGALLSAAVRRTGERRFAFRGVPWLHVLGRPALALASETAQVGRTLARAVLRGPDAPGAVVRQEFAPGSEDAGSAGRRGLVTLGLSLTPNSFVLRVPDGRDGMRLHRLAARAPSENRDWPL